MKRVYFIIILTVILLLSSCTSPLPHSQTTEPSSSTPDITSPEAEDKTVPANDETTAPNAPETPPSEADTEAPPVISGDFSNEFYDVTEKDGTCYLNFKDGNRLENTGNGTPSQQVGYIDFFSIDEMYSRLLEGKLSDQQIAVVKEVFTHTEDGIVFPNVKKLQIPVLPNDLNCGRVGITDDTYTVSLSAGGKISSGGTQFTDESLYRALYEKNFSKYYDNALLENVEITSSEFEGIPCEVGNYKTSAATFRNVSFTVEAEDGKMLSVMIRYCIKSYSGKIAESETCPRRVEIYCEQNGQYSITTLHDLTFAPSAEWLTSFGIAPYTPAN